jgi:hypothetical protein
MGANERVGIAGIFDISWADFGTILIFVGFVSLAIKVLGMDMDLLTAKAATMALAPMLAITARGVWLRLPVPQIAVRALAISTACFAIGFALSWTRI